MCNKDVVNTFFIHFCHFLYRVIGLVEHVCPMERTDNHIFADFSKTPHFVAAEKFGMFFVGLDDIRGSAIVAAYATSFSSIPQCSFAVLHQKQHIVCWYLFLVGQFEQMQVLCIARYIT